MTGVTASVGDLLVFYAGQDGGQVPSSVSDTAGNTWTVAGTPVRDTGAITLGMFFCVVSSALASGTITVTFAGLSGLWDKYAGLVKTTGTWNAATCLDKTSSGQATTGANWDSGSTATTSTANEVVIGAAGQGKNNSATVTSSAPGASLTELHDVDASLFIHHTSVYRVVSATGAYKANGTYSGNTNKHWIAQVATFKESSAAVAAARLDHSRSIFQPTLTMGAVTVAPARLDHTRQIFQPVLSTSAQFITLTRLDRSRVINQPTLTRGAVTVALSRLDRSRSIFSPTVGPAAPIAPYFQAAYGFRGQSDPDQVVE